MRHWFALALLPLLACGSTTAQPGNAADASLQRVLERPVLARGTAQRELTAFLDRRIPPLPPPAESPADWLEQAERTRQQLLDAVVFRGVPREWRDSKTRVVWGESLPGHGYTIRKLRYEAVPGLWIPALLYEPEGRRGRVPAVLNVNGHVGAPGKAIGYEQVRCVNLARRGMLALHPEWLGCGELSGAEYSHNRLAYLDLCGRSGVSVFYLAMRRGLDILEAHPRADRKRLAMTGLSGGGWQTILLSSLDRRVAASVPNAGYIGLRERIRNPGDIGDLEQNPVDLVRVADYPHLTALLAPRPSLLIYNERDDCCFATERARRSVYDPVRPHFAQFGAETVFRLHNNTAPGNHNYEKDNREQFYRFLNDVFRPAGERQDTEIPVDGEILSFDQLRVGIPAGSSGFGTLAEEATVFLPRRRLPADGSRNVERWQKEGRIRLAELLRFRAAEAVVSRESEHELTDGTRIVRRVLRAGDEWTVPVVELLPVDPPRGTAVLASQGGHASAAAPASELLRTGMRVLAVDLALCGEMLPPGASRGQYGMMLGAAGERLLGIQAAQLDAVLGWAAREFGTGHLTLVGNGRVGSVVAAAAAALSRAPVRELRVTGLPASLKLLIEGRVEYDAAPELFCFGLLELADVRELLGLNRVPRVVVSDAAGGRDRVERELAPLREFRARALPGSTLHVSPEP